MSTKHLYQSIMPILLVSAIFGLSSIYYKQGKLKILNVLKVTVIIYITLFVCYIYMACIQPSSFQPNYATGVSKVGLIFQFLGQVAVVLVAYTTNLWKCQQILQALDEISHIDGMFEDLGTTLDYRRHFNYQVSVLSAGLLAISGRVVVNYVFLGYVSATNDMLYFVFALPSFLLFVLQCQFGLFVQLLQERFSVVNRLLDNGGCVNTNKIQPLSDVYLKKNEYVFAHCLKRLDNLMEIHDQLVDVGNKFNANFGAQILVCFTSQFISVVFTAFYVYYESMVLNNLIVAANWSLWTLVIGLEIIHTTVTCHLTSREAKNAGITIHKVLMEEIDFRVRKKLMIFSQQVCHCPLQFTACGLFTIDATLIFTICGAAATYLLIMLQYQEGLESPCTNTTNIA